MPDLTFHLGERVRAELHRGTRLQGRLEQFRLEPAGLAAYPYRGSAHYFPLPDCARYPAEGTYSLYLLRSGTYTVGEIHVPGEQPALGTLDGSTYLVFYLADLSLLGSPLLETD